jgi:predicted permease
LKNLKKIIDKKTLKGISEITANILLPCLTLSDILKSFEITNYQLWLPILLCCLIIVFLGYITGYIFCFFLNISKDIKKLIIICFMFSNSTSYQLLYIHSLSEILAKMLGSTKERKMNNIYIIYFLYLFFILYNKRRYIPRKCYSYNLYNFYKFFKVVDIS